MGGSGVAILTIGIFSPAKIKLVFTILYEESYLKCDTHLLDILFPFFCRFSQTVLLLWVVR